MTQSQIGAAQTPSYSQALLKQLQRVAERFDLDTVETEELTQLASMVTGTASRSTCQERGMLMAGLTALNSTTNDPVLKDAILAALCQAEPGVRYAAIIRKHGKPTKMIVYLTR